MIKTVTSIQILGMIVDWSNQVEKVTKTCNFKIWKFYLLKNVL